MDELRKEMIDKFNQHSITEYIEKVQSSNGREKLQFTHLGQGLMKEFPDAIQMFFMNEDVAIDVMMQMERDKAVELLKYFHNHPSEYQEQALIYQAYDLNPDVRKFAPQYDTTYLKWVVNSCDYEDKNVESLFKKYPLKSLNVDYETSLSILRGLYTDTWDKIKPQIQESFDIWIKRNQEKYQSELLRKNDAIHIDFILKKSKSLGLNAPMLEEVIGDKGEHETKKSMEDVERVLNSFRKKCRPAIIDDGIKNINSFEIQKIIMDGKLHHFEINAKGEGVDITIKCEPRNFQKLNNSNSDRIVSAVVEELSKKSDGIVLEKDLKQVNIEANYYILTAQEKREINNLAEGRQDKSEFIKDAIEKIDGMEDQIIDR